MGDLISRSYLIERIKGFTNISSEYFKNPELLLDVIENQPTAYDVEKVVGELKKEKEIHTEHYNISLYKDYPEVKRRYEQNCCVIDKAIDIVKRGGVDERT